MADVFDQRPRGRGLQASSHTRDPKKTVVTETCTRPVDYPTTKWPEETVGMSDARDRVDDNGKKNDFRLCWWRARKEQHIGVSRRRWMPLPPACTWMMLCPEGGGDRGRGMSRRRCKRVSRRPSSARSVRVTGERRTANGNVVGDAGGGSALGIIEQRRPRNLYVDGGGGGDEWVDRARVGDGEALAPQPRYAPEPGGRAARERQTRERAPVPRKGQWRR